MTTTQKPTIIWQYSHTFWLLAGITALSMGIIFYEGIEYLISQWIDREEYSHGFLIPVISVYLVWGAQGDLQRHPFPGSWLGFLICLAGVAIYFLGELSTLYIIIQYALIVVLTGWVITATGVRGIHLFWVAVIFLLFMIPLPHFLYQNLSAQLQLISSELGVWTIRMFGISVYLEGNVIDLGTYKLQVVEACNGLRYLFPLMSFGFLCAYLFSAPLWQRIWVFLSTLPVTVLMNSFRIGVIGYLVEHWGQSQAEGFLHDFEGWVIFMACVAILFAEMWLLTRFTRKHLPFNQVFGLEFPDVDTNPDTICRRRPVAKPLLASTALLVIAALISVSIKGRVEKLPNRSQFVDFTSEIGVWRGQREQIEEIYLKVLELTDYLMINFRQPTGDRINFYVAYYQSQRAGVSAHSPRSCLPGGGWKIDTITQIPIANVMMGAAPLRANRVQIQQGDHRQLVYYWFQQRGRIITSEYWVKWFLFWDSLTRNRSDGALVRLTTALRPDEQWQDADARLKGFSKLIVGELDAYVPN